MTSFAPLLQRVSTDNIRAASTAIDPVFLNTPQFLAETISLRLGMRLVCKIETVNPIRSFKGRGADYFLHTLDPLPHRLVCASAGNFGQGLAFASRKRGVTVDVFVAETANQIKLEGLRRFGAELHVAGQDFDDAKQAARQFAEANRLRFVEDGAESAIAEGAGTIALELCRWPEPLDAILVPVGNGALINGIGAWMKAYSPQTKVIGVCASGAPAMELSWRAGRPVSTPTTNTIADGIAVRVPVPEALDDFREVVDDILLVDDKTLLHAIRLLFRELGLVIEPAGAAGVAAAMAYHERFQGQCVAVPLCGGNLSEAKLNLLVC